MMARIGGRKLLISLIMLTCGVIIDLNTTRGLSQNLMYLMMMIIGTFSTMNVVSKKFSKGPITVPSLDDERVKQLESTVSGLMSMAEQTNNQMETTTAAIDQIIGHIKKESK